MKYYMLNVTDASGHGKTNFTYIDLSDNSTLDDAKEIFLEENPWIQFQEVARITALEIDHKTYKAGLAFNEYAQYCQDKEYDEVYQAATGEHPYRNPKYTNNRLWEHHNMFPTRKWAEMLADPTKPVLIGYPKMFSVFKMDDKRNLHFVYHHSSTIDFRDDARFVKQ